MGLFDAFRYDGKRVLVVGAASGMGAATAALVQDAGADVVAMDFAPIGLDGAQKIKLNLSEKGSIDAALGEVGDAPFNAVFSCAGVADGTPGIERINFIGHRYLIDRLLERDQFTKPAAIGFISSAAGLGWEPALPVLNEYLDITDFDDATKWAQEHNKADYMSSKQAICAYVAREAMRFLKRGIRINAICPGPTDTPLAQANKDMWLGFGSDYREAVGVEPSTPLEQAYPLVFLCSDAASAITGTTTISDAGYFSAGMTESFPAAAPVAQFLLGRLT
jgi:NAD(P)-dependent dehydrogenase (short-subunit alcohol dehydrogenase family)